MSYTPPAGSAADFDFVSGSYTPPGGSAVDFTWTNGHSCLVACPTPLGAPALRATQTISTAYARASAPTPLGEPQALAEMIWAARVSVPSPLGEPAARAEMIWQAWAAVPSPLGMPAAVGTVYRYEFRGKVKAAEGALLVRRVRAYRRDTGALIAQGDSDGGKVRLAVGLEEVEFFLVPIDLDAAATDFDPPCINRVLAVLADDVAWEAL